MTQRTDRELLELAATAYFAQEVADGVCSFWWDEKEDAIVYIHGENQDYNGNDVELLWIPFDEDGDALRLAVKLGITLRRVRIGSLEAGSNPVVIAAVWDSEGVPIAHCPETLYPAGCNYAATRRAIVRAAAEIEASIK